MSILEQHADLRTVAIVNNGYCSNGYYIQDYDIVYGDNEAILIHKTTNVKLSLDYHLLVDQNNNKIGNTKEEIESFINNILE